MQVCDRATSHNGYRIKSTMPWLKLDDKMWRHPKVKALSAEAFRVHVAAMSYCAEWSTDGYVSPDAAKEVGATKRIAAELTRILPTFSKPLWVEHVAGGWFINDYLEYNPSRAEVEAERELRRSRAKKGGEARAAKLAQSKLEAQHQAGTEQAVGNGRAGAPFPFPEEDSISQEDWPLMRLLKAMGEAEHSQAHKELLSFRAGGASQFDFESIRRGLEKKRARDPRAYVRRAFENNLAKRREMA